MQASTTDADSTSGSISTISSSNNNSDSPGAGRLVSLLVIGGIGFVSFIIIGMLIRLTLKLYEARREQGKQMKQIKGVGINLVSSRAFLVDQV